VCCALGAEDSRRTVDVLHGEREMGGRLAAERSFTHDDGAFAGCVRSVCQEVTLERCGG